jgi:formylglycine-generating enzyme required for sulfatase activity
VLAVFVKVCEAVAYAHSKGVVHRDLKPSNVMVGAFGEAYVMDWGLARVVERLRGGADVVGQTAWVETDVRARIESTPGSPLATRDGAVIGTPAYMAPEQANGRVQDIGPSCDVYAIGAMLYQLLTGTMPYADSTSRLTPQALIAARLSRPPTPIAELAPDTAPELVAVCHKAMAESPSQRYASALELSDDLEAFLGRRPVRAFDSSLPYLVRLAIQRNRKTALAIAIGLLASAALVARDVLKSRTVAAREAQHSATLADANRRLQRDADIGQAKLLLQEEGTLRVASRDGLGGLRSWLEQSESVLRRAVERRSLAALAGPLHSADPSLPPNSPRNSPGEASAGRLEGNHEELELYADLSAAIGRVRERVQRVESREQSDRELWEHAVRDIAASPLYGGLSLRPQWGLAPLQRNPVSGLWEFWVVESGAAPRIADRASGRLELTAESAVVLVLLPGGRARLGSARNDLGRNLLYPSREGRGRVDNEDERFVELAPFFLGKTEVSQAAWRRVMGANPAHFSDDEACSFEPWTGLLPVESVNWNDARSFVEKLDLVLPSEAQWEYAARCGRSQPFAFGSCDDLAELMGEENLNDRLGSEVSPAPIGLLSQPWCDGYWSVAPVMSLAPNAWGLHDVLGNVSELCVDVYEAAPFGFDVLGVDGAWLAAEGRYRSFRGASFATPRAEAARVAFRQWDRPASTNHGRGLRVARPLR